MAILISKFNTRIGPEPFMVIPSNFNQDIVEKTVKLMDIMHGQEKFFIKDNPEYGVKSINMLIMVPSNWARGNKEMIQISVFSTEESPDINNIKNTLTDFKEKLVDTQHMFLAFYKGIDPRNIPEKDDLEALLEEIQEKYGKLEEWARDLDEQIKIDTPTAYTYVSSVKELAKNMEIPLPKSALNELKKIVQSTKDDATNLFMVFRKVGDMMKLDIIPSSAQVMKVRIIVKELTSEFIMKTSQVIGLPLLYTAGICQEAMGRCSYEAYFSLKGQLGPLKQQLMDDLKSLERVEKVEISLIE
ncbi:MAG: hypothetical protein ACFFCS_21650 [Candidatus Hodarchaeota archaeon]